MPVRTLVVVLLLSSMASAAAGGERAAELPDADDPLILPCRLDRRLPEVRFDGAVLSDVLEFWGDVTGARVFVDWKAIGAAGVPRDAPVAGRLKDVKFSESLTRTFAFTRGGDKLAWYEGDGEIVITSADAVARPRIIVELPGCFDARLESIDFDDAPFERVLDYVRHGDVPIVPDWDALKAAGVERSTPITIHLRGHRRSATIRRLLEIAGDGQTRLRVAYEDETITIKAAPEPAKK